MRRSVLAQCPACSSLRDAKLGRHMICACAAAGEAQKFPFAASARISLSSVRSETARRRRLFSVSSSFSRFT